MGRVQDLGDAGNLIIRQLKITLNFRIAYPESSQIERVTDCCQWAVDFVLQLAEQFFFAECHLPPPAQGGCTYCAKISRRSENSSSNPKACKSEARNRHLNPLVVMGMCQSSGGSMSYRRLATLYIWA